VKMQQHYTTIENGKAVIKQQEVEQNVANSIHKSLGEFGGKFTTADGTALTAEQATKRVKDGATLLVTADGKPVDKGWLRAVEGDTVIMVAEGLAHAHFQYAQGYNAGPSALPTTAAPRLVMLCPDEAGAVKLAVNTNGVNNGNQIYYDDFRGGRVIRGGGAVMIQNGVAWGVDDGGFAPVQPDAKPGPDGKKLLADVKFDAFDLNGKLVPRAEALKRLKAGGLVLLAGDNRFPDPEYLKAFREDVLVLASGEFVFPQGMTNPYDMPVKPTAQPAPGPGKPAPPIAQPVPAIGLVAPAAQLKIAPAVIKQAAVPAPAPAVDLPAPKPEAKPAAKPEEKPAEKPAAAPAKPAVNRN
jgi:hypothetical protein